MYVHVYVSIDVYRESKEVSTIYVMYIGLYDSDGVNLTYTFYRSVCFRKTT